MPEPLVTSIIPLYDAQRTIRHTLESLRRQTLTDWEAIVVDDGSRDRGPDIAHALARDDPRFRVVSQPNAGLARARNAGLELARGRFIHVLDADDWLLPDALERLTSAAHHTGAACGSYLLAADDTAELGALLPAPHPHVALDHLLDGNRLAPHAHLVDRRLLDHRRFDARWPEVADYRMWLDLALAGVRWQTVPGPVAVYRVSAGSMSKRAARMALGSAEAIRDAYNRARTLGLPDSTTRQRERCALAAASFFYALVGALAGDPPEPDPAWTSLDAARVGTILGWALLLTLGRPGPEIADDSARWLPRIDPLLRAAAGPNLTGARTAAAAVLVDRRRIARTLLDGVRPDDTLVIIGAGANGWWVIRESLERSLRIDLRDDAPASLAPDLAPRIASRPVDAPIDPGAVVVVTPSHDAPLLPRLRRSARRWRAAEDILAREIIAALHHPHHAPAAR